MASPPSFSEAASVKAVKAVEGEDLTLIVDCTPGSELFPGNDYRHFIEMPSRC
jgi:hypothetical protein